MRASVLAIAPLLLATTAPHASVHPRRLPLVARFDLAVDKSTVLKTGKSHVDAQSVFITHTNEFLRGRGIALKIQFFAKPIDAAANARLMKNDRDNNALTGAGAAFFVLQLDDRNAVKQADLSYQIPGTTVARTIAWLPDSLAKYFSDLRFENGRVRLKSKGTYVTGPDSPNEVLTLSWDVDLDAPVIERIK
jgi:hypothetical protein